jgi:hypothetical protein
MRAMLKATVVTVMVGSISTGGGCSGTEVSPATTTVTDAANDSASVCVAPMDVPAYPTEPLRECYDCRGGEPPPGFDTLPCCTDGFGAECAALGGVVRGRDLHPAGTSLQACFPNATDTGHACCANTDCSVGFCDFSEALVSGRCKEVSRTTYDTVCSWSGDVPYDADYQCDSPSPGKCPEAPKSGVNPGGRLQFDYSMSGTTLKVRTSCGGIS